MDKKPQKKNNKAALYQLKNGWDRERQAEASKREFYESSGISRDEIRMNHDYPRKNKK